MNESHKASLDLATAALWDIISKGKAIQAATLRRQQEDVEAMRCEAHDILDAYLDHMTAAATHVRQITE